MQLRSIFAFWPQMASICKTGLVIRFTNNNRERLFVGAPHNLGEHLKSNYKELRGQNESKYKGARSAHRILCLRFLVLRVALYDETKMMLYSRKSHEIGHTNHRQWNLLSCKFEMFTIKVAHWSYSRISKCCVSLCTEYTIFEGFYSCVTRYTLLSL